MDIGQKHCTIARRRHGTNSKRWPHQFAVDQRRACVPTGATLYSVKTRQAFLRAIRGNAQDARVFSTDKDKVSTWNAARKVKVASCDPGPFAIRGSSAERVPPDDREHAAMSIGHQAANRLPGALGLNHILGDAEHAVVPRCYENGRNGRQSKPVWGEIA